MSSLPYPISMGLAASRASGLLQRGQRVAARHWRASRVLDCAAGFYRTADIAEFIAAVIRREYHLSAQQVTVLGPADGAPLRYHLLSRQWAPLTPASMRGLPPKRWLGAALGALALGALSTAWAAQDNSMSGPVQMLAAAAGAAMGAVLGFGAMLLAPLQGRSRRFDRSVQHQLAAGDFAVVVHHVPRPQQVEVVTGLRDTGHKWCALAPHQNWT